MSRETATRDPNINDILNDDCLIHLFSFMTIFDIITMTRVCKKILRIAEIMYPSKFRKTNLQRIGCCLERSRNSFQIIWTLQGGIKTLSRNIRMEL